MQGTYDTGLVLLSLLIAALASYVAIEFAGRIFERREQRGRWLAAGSLAMGSGIWSMHFVGMAAFTLPIPVSYDLGITVFSWVAAVAVSGLALHLVSRGSLSATRIGLGALAMGAGVCVMHYAGMGAMRMDPGLGYDLPWFIASVLIAVGASAAALVIVARLRVVRSLRDIGLRVAAALIMGLAVAGMHYSGMAAVQFDPNAFCAPGNLLDGGTLTTPTVLASLLGLGFALFFAVSDARAVFAARRAARAEQARLSELAFVDRETGLDNRARFSQHVVQAMRQPGPMSVVSLRPLDADGEELRGAIPALARALASLSARGHRLARTSPGQLMLLVEGAGASRLQTGLLAECLSLAAAALPAGARLAAGVAECGPEDENAVALMLRAGSRAAEVEAPDDGPGALGELSPYRAPAPATRGNAA